MKMSKALVILFVCFMIVSAVTVYGASEVQVNGVFRITPGGSIIFGDGTTQTTAATGEGVAIGITKVVHGLVGADGLTAATTFSVTHSGTGFYTVTFATSFSSAPTCTVTSLGHQNDGMGYVACELSAVPTTNSVAISCFQYEPKYNSGSGSYYYSYIATDTPFSLICVQ
jgi:hypothetical protein